MHLSCYHNGWETQVAKEPHSYSKPLWLSCKSTEVNLRQKKRGEKSKNLKFAKMIREECEALPSYVFTNYLTINSLCLHHQSNNYTVFVIGSVNHILCYKVVKAGE